MRGLLKEYWILLFLAGAVVLSFLVAPFEPSACYDADKAQTNCRGYHLVFAAEEVVKKLKELLTLLVAALAVFIAATLKHISEKQVRHFEIAERAYVKMSHRPPGLEFDSDTSARVEIKISNNGQTPAYISAVLLKADFFSDIDALPDTPDYSGAEPRSSAFLVKGDSFRTVRRIDLPEGVRASAENGDSEICLFGYVDYRDQFGGRHRAGYARWFSCKKHADKNSITNLYFVARESYNYDRLRTRNQGNDWDRD